jgi:hypothetical protein
MKLLFILFLIPIRLLAQDIAGLWTGIMYNDTTDQYIKYELAISENEGKLSGYSHTTFLIDSIKNIGIKLVKIEKEGDIYLVEDDKLVYNNYSAPPAKGVKMTSLLTLIQKNDSTQILRGPWSTNQTRIYKKLTGNIYLEKKKKIAEDVFIPKLEELGLARSLLFMDKREQANANKISDKPVSLSAEHGNLSNVKEQQDTLKSDNLAKDSQSVRTIKPTSNRSKPENDGLGKQQIEENRTAVSGSNSEKINQDKIPDKGNSLKKDSSRITIVDRKISDQDLKNENIKNANLIAKQEPKAAADISSRKIETIRSVEIINDSLTLTLYDNGEVDGDTVSVLLNGKVIMPMEGLSTKAIDKTVYLTPEMGDSIVLVMYAENLGSIPPNTGLLIVHDGEKNYYISFSGDFHKNAAIILKRKRKK